jgi:hypothetical protein
MKKALKIIGLLVALTAAFFFGFCWTALNKMIEELGSPYIKSDYEARSYIKERLPDLPETAHHLYYARKGFQGFDEFFACSVPVADFPSLLAQVDELVSSRGSANAIDVAAHGPDSWDNSHKDPSWDLSSYSDIVTVSKNGHTIMYSPSKHRVFVCMSYIAT